MTTTTEVAQLIVKLKEAQPNLADIRHCRSDAEKADLWARYNELQHCVTGLQNAPDQLAQAEARLVEPKRLRARWKALEKEIQGELDAAPDWRQAGNVQQRDAEYDRQSQLRMRKRLLESGELLVAPNTVCGRIEDIEARLQELTEKRDQARSMLDSWIQQAKTLLGETLIDAPAEQAPAEQTTS